MSIAGGVNESAEATLTIQADAPANFRISRFLTGKFAEHLGSNIYNGMCAEILRNPTFADFPFADGTQGPDGLPHFLSDERSIQSEIRRQSARLRWPQDEVRRLVDSRADALAHWWVKVGPRDAVHTSPDIGPFGGRAQRIEVDTAGQGIAQWTHLPLHRVHKYEFELVVRSPDLSALNLAVTSVASATVAQVEFNGVSDKWSTLRGSFEIPADANPQEIYRFAITAPAAGQFVVERALLWPADHVNGADPDIIHLLKESHLPILRWPGGNFVSAYRWEEGVGPTLARPTRPNYAWGGVEPNLFGTDEFIAFCRAVGAEPMVCINAGDGTPAEAARWVEYCNGPLSSPMGARRAANGHPLPYNVHFWEVGNELWGHWQVNWTTPRGYVDRFRQFSDAMRAADPQIELFACGAPVLQGPQWNRALVAGGGNEFARITDHPLIGGNVPSSVDPLDVYRNFMATPDILGTKWEELRESMLSAGVREPRLAISELQLFAHLSGGSSAGARLTRETLVNPGTQGEAVYDTLMYHTAIRLGSFVELITHSAVVNHGGGLRKEFERVYANPCFYAQSAFADFAGATPVSTQVQCATEHAPTVLPDLSSAGSEITYPTISAVAAKAGDGSLLVSIVNRGATNTHLQIAVNAFHAAPRTQLWSLAAQVPWAANSFQYPDAVQPKMSTSALNSGSLVLDLPPYSVARVQLAGEK